MATIAVFHSVLGVRQGVHDADARLQAAGHHVRVVDQYEGRTFEDYPSAIAFSQQVGMPELIRRGLEAVADLPEGFIALGFSNGAVMAELCAFHYRPRGAVCFAGALPVSVLVQLGALPAGSSWPPATALEVLTGKDDALRTHPEWVTALHAEATAAGAAVRTHAYPGGHLFTDASLPGEYNADSARAAWTDVASFLGDDPEAWRGALDDDQSAAGGSAIGSGTLPHEDPQRHAPA